MTNKISIKEKIGYALGDGAANIAWRGVSTFLFIFYTDVFGLDPVSVGLLMLVARSSDGISDILMGVIGDRSNSKYGKFRPWILWTAVPLALILSLLFTVPEMGEQSKIVYAYITYILFTLIYTANNIPYGALMAVMTGDDKERTSLGSYRMVGAFAGGMLVQGALLYLVVFFGNVNPEINVYNIPDSTNYEVVVSAPLNVESARIKLDKGIGKFAWADNTVLNNDATASKSFQMEANKEYRFIVTDIDDLNADRITIINQKEGYSKSMYLLSVFLAIFMIITFLTTKERVKAPKDQKSDIKKDLKQLFRNKPWAVLLVIGLLFNIYTAIKQGIVVIYFAHYLHQELLAASFMVALTLASIGGAMLVAPLGKIFGKKKLFIYALIFSAAVNCLFVFCGPQDTTAIFIIGIISEAASAMFPTLLFVMLGDAADFSEWKNGRRATGLIYSAGSLATKFGGGIAGAIIGFVLSYFNYNGQNQVAIEGAIPGMIMLMSWVPAIVAIVAAAVMMLYPLNKKKMDVITSDLNIKRAAQLKEHV
ncbi:MFS transporter [Formosa sp. PL04]|uniref:MFS transporter n=1 Tax=Formosa sp. PL04 TaxID=3081755 RepID=UPI0029818559|nr:MFS transporter [Formosa sp. PL04]MDW5288024.1 MFS transporter [Formosa sp. PL04]